ncbi:hypothetical protein R1sor_026713 [Riccia sorocarpa]|uniref:Uncharacterized protein n=1 Tax=Riccia sorocarpa TaxID=122646 RepID=A0ABD3GFG6_9MARC
MPAYYLEPTIEEDPHDLSRGDGYEGLPPRILVGHSGAPVEEAPLVEEVAATRVEGAPVEEATRVEEAPEQETTPVEEIPLAIQIPVEAIPIPAEAIPLGATEE